ncbi:hypothetical protein WA026_010258 [Henosepilachna vigintioctopunctata]|uniref:Uncharacterized protein n=1 Tax=Henosepilachna vigintioctopunctata TaxID=420089 RepID=A0AAW1UI60_9CUCU
MCPINAGCWQGRPKELFDHFSIRHSRLIKIYNSTQKEISFTFESEQTVFEYSTILDYGKVFTIQLARNHRKGIACYGATNLEPFDTSAYECMIEFELGNGQRTTTILNFTQSNNTTRERRNVLPTYDLPVDLGDRSYAIILNEKP